MAFVLLGPIGRYLGASGDAKPTTGIATGSVCQETDTGKVYMFNGAAWVEQVPSVRVSGPVEATISGSLTSADALANPADLNVKNAGFGMLFNGTTWDRQRGNMEGTLLASAARTESVASPNQTNYNAKGVIVYLKVTKASGTGGLVVRISSIDPIGGVVLLNAPPTPITANGTTAYVLYVGASGANISQCTGLPLPRRWGVSITHNDASSYTYSVSYALVL